MPLERTAYLVTEYPSRKLLCDLWLEITGEPLSVERCKNKYGSVYENIVTLNHTQRGLLHPRVTIVNHPKLPELHKLLSTDMRVLGVCLFCGFIRKDAPRGRKRCRWGDSCSVTREYLMHKVTRWMKSRRLSKRILTCAYCGKGYVARRGDSRFCCQKHRVYAWRKKR